VGQLSSRNVVRNKQERQISNFDDDNSQESVAELKAATGSLGMHFEGSVALH